MSTIDSLTGFKAMCGTFTGLTVIAVTLRFVARKKNEMPLKADDWLMLTALILFLGNMTTVFLLARVGFSGYNGGNGSNQTNIYVQQVTSSYRLLLIWTLGAAKASVLFFYKRVFCQHRKMNNAFRVVIIATLIINALWVIAFFFLGLFQCGNHFNYGGNYFRYCTLLNQYQMGFYISDIILDVWIMAIPIPYIIRLNASRLRRYLTVVVFLLCFVGLGASIARLVNYLQSTKVNPAKTNPSSPDSGKRPRSAWTTYEWFGTLEAGTAIVAINMPTLYGLFTKHAPEIILRVTRSWTSIGSRAINTPDGSITGFRRGSDVSIHDYEPTKLVPPHGGTRTFVSADGDRASMAEVVRPNEVYVQRTVEVTREKAHEEV